MGEFELLARVRERLQPPRRQVALGSGDDAAITLPEGATATSVDALVDGVHFDRERATLAQIGHKALATALSDLAAMGAEAGEAYVTVGLPSDLDEDGCLELVDGLLELAAATGTTVAGGGVTRAGELFLAIAVVGHASRPEQLVRRSGARPGDALVLSGEVGGAAAGLLTLQHPQNASSLSPEVGELLRRRQLEPRPRLAAGMALAGAGATAMIDLSDGLGGDAAQLAESSRVALRIEAETVPLATGLDEVARKSGGDAWQMAFAGGEDYELLATLPPERFEEAAAAVEETEGVALSRIGEVAAGEGVEIRLPGGGLLEAKGYDQLG